MKKLFKHLAIVLALALVIGLVPARTAEAADYSLKFKNKYLYVGAKGETAHGVDTAGNLPAKPIKRSLKFGGGVIDGLKDGDVVTFKSADRAVARGSKKYQRVFAIGVGETDVAVKVNGEEIGSMHFIVKQNAKSLAIDAASELGIGDVEIKVNVEPASATDIISLVIPEEYKDIAVVKEGTTITTKKPGTFKIQAVAQQNDSTLTGYHVKSDEIEAQAAVKVISAVQKSADEVLFTFDNDMTGIVDVKDFKVYYKPVNGADVTTAVEAATVQDDPTKVIVKLWNKFVEGTEYFVEYSGQVSTFTTAKLGIANAASIRFNELKITKGKVTNYDLTVLDANGVELPDEMLDYVTCAGDSTDKITISDKTILFDEAGLKANVTATFDAWYEDSDGNAKQNTFKNAGLFESVDAEVVKISSLDWTFANWAGTPKTVASKYADPNHLIAVDDDDIKLSCFNMLITFSDGSKLAGAAKDDGSAFIMTAVKGLTDDDNFAEKVKPYITIEIADPGIAESANGFIRPVKVGTTQILVKNDGSIVSALNMDVKAKAVPATMTITSDKVKLNTDPTGWDDTVTFDVVVKDQYGRFFPDAEMSVKEKSHSPADANVQISTAAVMARTDDDGESSVTFTSEDSVAGEIRGTGTLVLEFTAKGAGKTITNTSKSVQCQDTVGETVAWKLDVAEDELDERAGSAAVVNGLRAYKYETTIKRYGVDSKGFRTTDGINVKKYGSDNYTAATGTLYAYKAFNGGKEVETQGFSTTEWLQDNKFSVLGVDSGVIQKLPAKSVVIKLYQIDSDYNNDPVPAIVVKKTVSVDTVTVTITDSQPELYVEKVDDNVSAANAALKSFNSNFYVEYNGANVSAAVVYPDAKVGTKSAYVKSVILDDPDPAFAGAVVQIEGTVGYTLVVK